MNWVWWIIAILVAGLAYYWFVVVRLGNRQFWKLAAKNPDAALAMFTRESCWYVNQVPNDLERSRLTGPFRLFVPRAGGLIKIWGVHPEHLESQKEFVEKFSRTTK